MRWGREAIPMHSRKAKNQWAGAGHCAGHREAKRYKDKPPADLLHCGCKYAEEMVQWPHGVPLDGVVGAAAAR